MEQQFEAVLTGTDTPVNGIVTQHSNGSYEFNSFDDSLNLVIARNQHDHWERIAGSEPYLTGWVDELAEQIHTTF